MSDLTNGRTSGVTIVPRGIFILLVIRYLYLSVYRFGVGWLHCDDSDSFLFDSSVRAHLRECGLCFCVYIYLS